MKSFYLLLFIFFRTGIVFGQDAGGRFFPESCIVIILLVLWSGKSFCQKTFHVSLYDASIFNSDREHQSSLWFTNQPTQEGRYIVYQDSTFETHRIWRYFFIDKDGKVINKKEYCCYFDVVDLKEEANINFNTHCDDATTYLLNEMTTYGYNRSDLDSATINTYTKNSNFRKHIETYKVYDSHPSSPMGNYVSQKIFLRYTHSCANDYEIVLKNSDTFRISHIVTHEYKPKKNITGNFCTMYSYEVNGRKVTNNIIVLVRPGYEKSYMDTKK